jgi:hypothetical protein
LKLYKPVALQSLGRKKLSQEAAFKAVLHQLCAAAAGEYAFLECAPDQHASVSLLRHYRHYVQPYVVHKVTPYSGGSV